MATKRTYWIDALRFFSMIIVFLSHLRMAFFIDKLNYLSIGNFRFVNYFFDGNLAVCMFLIISVFLFANKA